MKFFRIVLLLLFVFDGLKGLTLPPESPDKGLNTTLLANFSGLYVRRNPCSNEKVETSSYEASHEFHHCDKEQNWTDLTDKCSALITSFLKSVCSLIKFNNKRDGTFTLNVNTSISQKQVDQHNCKDRKYSLPTIVIKATDYADLTGEEPKQKAVNGVSEKEKIPLGELSAISQESSTTDIFRNEAEADLHVTEIPERPVKTFKRSRIGKPERFSPLQNPNTKNFEAMQESENAFKQIRNKYVAEKPRSTTINTKEKIMPQTDRIARLTLDSTEKSKLRSDNQFRNSKFVPNREKFSSVSQSELSSNSVRMEASDFISPASLTTQQPTNLLSSRAPKLAQDDNPNLYLTTVSPKISVKEQEIVEEEFSEKSESLIAGNARQTVSLNGNFNPTVRPIQPAESLDYLKNQAEFSIPNIPVGATILPEDPPNTDRYEQGNVPTELPHRKKQPQMLKQSDILPYTHSTSVASPGTSIVKQSSRTHLDASQPQPKNLFQQGFDYPVSDKINQAPAFSQHETHLTSSEKQTELNRAGQYHTTISPKIIDPRYITPSTFPADEFTSQKAITQGRTFELPSQKPLPSAIIEKTGNVYNTQPGSISHQETTPIQPAESLSRANQEANEATVQGPLPSSAAQYEKEVVDQFESSEQSDSTYAQIPETTLGSNQNFPGSPFQDKIENGSPREQLKSKAVLPKESTQPLHYLPTTLQPMSSSYDKKPVKNLTFRSERQEAGQLENFSEQTTSFKLSNKRPPATESTADVVPVTYSPQRKVVSSLEKEIEITESSKRQALQAKPNFYSSHIPNYSSPTPPQDNLFLSDSSLASDTLIYDHSDSLSTASSSSSPAPIVSGSKSQIISEVPRPDYYDILDVQPPSNRNKAARPLNKLLEDSPSTPYSGFKSKMTTTVYESDTISSQQNQKLDALSTRIYEPQTISTPPLPEMINPVKFQHNAKNMHISNNYPDHSDTPKTAAREYKKNFDSFTISRTPSEPELGKFSTNQLPVGQLPSAFPSKDIFSERAVKTTENINSSSESRSFTLKPLGYQTSPSLLEVQQPLKTSANTPGRNQFPAEVQHQSRTTEQFSETTTDSSGVHSHQSSSAILPISASQNVEANTSYNDRQDSLLTVDSESKKASASEKSYHLNQNNAETFSKESQHDDISSSQDPKTQIPQPQPSDYSGQLSSNERESNTASTDLQTSKTFEGSKPNIQPLLTYSPLPSVPAKIQTFSTETYESGDLANEYPDEPKAIGSSALEKAKAGSSSFSQSSAQNIETIDITEVYSTPTYNDRFVPTTSSPPLTALEEPLFVKTSLPAQEKYLDSKTFIQDISTTPRPPSINSVKYDQEIITIDSQPTPSPSPVALLPVKHSGQFLNRKKEHGFADGNLAAAPKTEDRLERFNNKVTTSESVLKTTNKDLRNGRVIETSTSNEDIEAPSTALIKKIHHVSPQQLPAQGVTLPLLNNGTNNLLKIETNPDNVGQISSTVRPVHTKTTFDEEVITTDNSNSVSLAATLAPPVGHPQRLSNTHFDGQRHHFPGPPVSQSLRQFYPENRPLYHPHQGFPPQQFGNRPHGNYPHPMDFNPQAPIPRFNHFDDFAREQHNQYPPSFQQNQFESHFPVPNQFQPGLDTQRSRFMFPGHPSNYGSRYFPDGRPNFHYNQPPRSGMNSESFSSQVPPNFRSFQRPDVSEERDFHHQPHLSEERLAEGNFNTQLIAPHYAPNFEPYSYRPRDGFNVRFGPNYQSFGPEPRDGFRPDQISYNQRMPPYRNYPAGHFDPHGPAFLNNTNQQVEDRYEPHTSDHPATSIEGAKTQQAQESDINQATPKVLDDYKKALTGLASGERLVEFDEEVITISPEKGPNFETTVVTEEHEQRQDDASYNLRNQGRQKTGFLHEFNNTAASGQKSDGPLGSPPHQAQGNSVFRASSQNHPMPFPQSVDSVGPQLPHSLPNSSNRFRSVSSDFQHQSNANFVSPRLPNGGSVVGSNPSQSDSHAVGPHQISPSSKPDPTSSRRSNAPGSYRNPLSRPHTAPETLSNG